MKYPTAQVQVYFTDFITAQDARLGFLWKIINAQSLIKVHKAKKTFLKKNNAQCDYQIA